MKPASTLSLLLAVLVLSACSAAPAAPPTTATPPTAATAENAAPAHTATLAPTPTAPNTAATEALPTPTATALPPAPRWYWVMDENANALIAVNQYGQQNRWDAPPYSDLTNLIGFALGDGRLLLLDGGAPLRAYLATPEAGLQSIQLPSGLNYDPGISQYSPEGAAASERYLVFGYTDQPGGGNLDIAIADRGPLLLVDLNTRTARLLDTQVHRGLYSRETREWAYRSNDGRFLRYLQGEAQSLNLRELDLATGETRTVYTARDHVTSQALGSVQGDLWRFTRSNVIIDLNGNQMEFVSETRTFRPLRNGVGLEFTANCADNCEIQLVTPFTDQPDQTYVLPWHTFSIRALPLFYILTPDQSLIFTGGSLSRAPTPPAILNDYPEMEDFDAPVFRLAPNGSARLVGRYVREFDTFGIPISSDGRYMLLGAADHQSFFFYDTWQDAILTQLPAQRELDYFGEAIFLSQGRIAHLTAMTPNRDYVDSFLVHSDYSGAAYAWQEENVILGDCFDLLEDDSLVCTLYLDPNDYLVNLVLYHLPTGEIRTLIEQVILYHR